ncbi:hypothetical protein EMCRGX_G032333 [Ephydatia muelleri]
MTPVRAAKAELRKVIRNALSSMSPEQKQSETESLVMKFLMCPALCTFRTFLKSGSRKCFVPRFDGTGMHMLRVHSFEDYNTLPLNKWNISQPESCDGREEGVSAGLDLILVPGLAFTKDGVRLGRGKGYYDSYIARCLEAGLKPHLLSLSFSCQLCENIPVTDRDRNVDRVILP